jgi:hypothetical protein
MREYGGLVMVQRDEGVLLDANVRYHLSVGFSRIVVVDNCSEDPVTLEILAAISENPRITVLYDKSPICDQAKLANWGLSILLDEPKIQWVFPCDADEFIWCGDGDVETFLSKCRQRDMFYGTLPWLNNLPESLPKEGDPLFYLRGRLFYTPFPERGWHQPSHFRKAFCLRHSNMEIIVGGHFFRLESNPDFFTSLNSCPAELTENEAVMFHYEMRDYSSALLKKWQNLAERHVVSGITGKNGQWSEKEIWMGELRKKYDKQSNDLFEHFALSQRTLWGTPIQPERLRRRSELSNHLNRAGILTEIKSV